MFMYIYISSNQLQVLYERTLSNKHPELINNSHKFLSRSKNIIKSFASMSTITNNNKKAILNCSDFNLFN